MIESVYWKTELKKQIRTIKRLQRCRRWSEKQLVLLEREIMIAFFCVRSLIEREKLPHKLVNRPIPVVTYPAFPGVKVTILNRGAIDELYDLDRPHKKRLTLAFLSNQIIHSYISSPIKAPRTRQFDSLLVCSDYERNRQLFEVEIKELVAALAAVAASDIMDAHLSSMRPKATTGSRPIEA